MSLKLKWFVDMDILKIYLSILHAVMYLCGIPILGIFLAKGRNFIPIFIPIWNLCWKHSPHICVMHTMSVK